MAESLDPEELTGYVWPTRHSLITGRMGPRDFGAFVIIDGQEVHDGLDTATHCGGRVRSAHDGTVLYAGRNFDPYIGYLGDPSPIYDRLQRLGRVNDQPIVVVIDDGNGYRSMYVHLQKALAEPGQAVEAGDMIGLEGDTGYRHRLPPALHVDPDGRTVATGRPSLARFGYPPFVRERVNPLRVLPWGDPFAPQRLQDRVNGTPSPLPPTATPAASPSLTPTATPSAQPDKSASPTGSN